LQPKTLKPKFLFVGEAPSKLANRINASWRTGQLSAKVLHDALRAMGIDPVQHKYINLWADYEGRPRVGQQYPYEYIWRAYGEGYTIVAMGQKVHKALGSGKTLLQTIPHLTIVHPAARGKIRLRANYQAHVKEVLTSKGVRRVA
jgi:uracil-DNA glycosylase